MAQAGNPAPQGFARALAWPARTAHLLGAADPESGMAERFGAENLRGDEELMSRYEVPENPADAGRWSSQDQQALLVQSWEDTDIAWGEQPEPDENDRLYRDRPPHWDSE